MQLGGAFLPMGGVAAVVSRPESRNNGLVRDLMTRMHQQMRAEKRPLAVLMPFKNSFYGRMGYADAFRLWIMCAFDDDVLLRTILQTTGIPDNWAGWIAEEASYA